MLPSSRRRNPASEIDYFIEQQTQTEEEKMRISEIQEQVELAKKREIEMAEKLAKTEASANAVIARAEQLVRENEAALASAIGHKDAAGDKVGQFKNAFEAASNGLKKRLHDIKKNKATIACCDNAISYFWQRRCHAEMQLGSLRAKAHSCKDARERASIEADIAVQERFIADCSRKIEGYNNLKAKAVAELPRIEYEAEKYTETMSRVKVQLESAEEALKAAIEQEKIAMEAHNKSCEMRDKDVEESNRQLQKATDAHNNAKEFVKYWEQYLNAAISQLQAYSGGRS